MITPLWPTISFQRLSLTMPLFFNAATLKFFEPESSCLFFLTEQPLFCVRTAEKGQGRFHYRWRKSNKLSTFPLCVNSATSQQLAVCVPSKYFAPPWRWCGSRTSLAHWRRHRWETWLSPHEPPPWQSASEERSLTACCPGQTMNEEKVVNSITNILLY